MSYLRTYLTKDVDRTSIDRTPSCYDTITWIDLWQTKTYKTEQNCKPAQYIQGEAMAPSRYSLSSSYIPHFPSQSLYIDAS